jgi:hypothetical protein
MDPKAQMHAYMISTARWFLAATALLGVSAAAQNVAPAPPTSVQASGPVRVGATARVDVVPGVAVAGGTLEIALAYDPNAIVLAGASSGAEGCALALASAPAGALIETTLTASCRSGAPVAGALAHVDVRGLLVGTTQVTVTRCTLAGTSCPTGTLPLQVVP